MVEKKKRIATTAIVKTARMRSKPSSNYDGSPQEGVDRFIDYVLLGDANDQFTVKVADTMEDAIKLMEVGFEFHAEVEGHKLFRKRKQTMDNPKN